MQQQEQYRGLAASGASEEVREWDGRRVPRTDSLGRRGLGARARRPCWRRRQAIRRAVRETRYVRKQYHFWPAEPGFDAWDVDRLIALSRGLPIERVAVDAIGEIDTAYWFDGSDEVPTVRKVVEHARLISQVDVSYPIILGPDGRVMDGMHRIARALLEGWPVIDAVRFTALPEPDYRGCQPDELPY